MHTRLSYLLKAYYEKTATAEERRELAELLRQPENQAFLPGLLSETWDHALPDAVMAPGKADAMLVDILENGQPAVVRKLYRWWYAVAALLVVALGIATWWMMDEQQAAPPPVTQVPAQDVPPGNYKATLTLDGGKVIALDTARAGLLAQQGITAVNMENGRLTYAGKPGEKTAPVYNMLSTSRGETYSLTLADGSVAFLNAASTIRFPVSFPGAERRVEITGEVFFKVAKDPSKPFIVHAKTIDVQALGTAFNVNAYDDEEALTATLEEGAVRVTAANGQQTVLAPAQQARLQNNKLAVQKNINVAAVTAWRNGLFHFESADLQTILKQLARWYDIEVVYEGKVSNEKFFSIMKRSSTLNSVLKALQANGVQFRIEGKKLTVQSSG